MKTDVTIVGAGLAGLIASIQFSQIGYNVACIDYKGEKNKKATCAVQLCYYHQ